MINYGATDFREDVWLLVKAIDKSYDYIYAVPRGGIALAVALSQELKIPLAENPFFYDDKDKANVLVVDDIIDSGKTRVSYREFDFACLHKKLHCQIDNISYPPTKTYSANPAIDDWVQYFWEAGEEKAEDAVIRTIQAIGDVPNREGLVETPKRVVKSWEELYNGYKQEPKDIFTSFSSDGYNQLVLLKDIEFFSMCEHHMLPFFGKAHIAYIPNTKVVGISKLARLLDIHSRKLQIQERIGEEVTKDIMEHLDARGAACIIEAQHLCMRMRGVGKQHSIMTTSSVKGTFLEDGNARAELMGLIK
jgi:GTP cyclohydrolase I|tara:strand:- start:76 stop:993 length:918 start_codon:yes stop_codon:yes gene_type:complete